MNIFGWIALVVLALVGLVIIVYAVGEFMVVQVRLFNMKISKEIEVMREDINERGELRRARLARKREAQDKIANRKLDVQIEAKEDKSKEKFGDDKK